MQKKAEKINRTFVYGGILGLLSLLIGTYIEHSLRLKISAEEYRNLMTALRYHQIYAVLITIFGALKYIKLNKDLYNCLNLTSLLFSIGVSLFSFSIYAAVIFSAKNLVFITPFGGVILILAWLYLIISASKIKLSKGKW